MRLMRDQIDEIQEHIDAPDPDNFDIGVTEDVITTTVDVREFVDRKRAAMSAHASQITEESFFLAMPAEAVAEGFGYEWFIRRGEHPGVHETSLFAGLDARA
jgi:LmbE family N-acetylglucosaminyl deacetylase